MDSILVVNNLKKKYGNFLAVNDINFSINKKECVALLGKNGAGKTSTLKMIYSSCSITSGTIEILGQNVVKNPKTTKRSIGVVSQDDLLDYSLNVIENMIAHAICYGVKTKTAKEKSGELLKFVGLGELLNKKVYELSGGMRRKLVLARSLINDPKLIILDEPTTGLDIQSRHAFWDKLDELKRNDIAILLTSHYLDEVERLAERILIINNGKIVDEGTKESLPKKYGFDNLEKVFLHLTSNNEVSNV